MTSRSPHPKFIPLKPQGQPTRGKTARNRLRRVDTFLMRYAPELIRRRHGPYADACVVDLGYGAEPFTTLEMAARLRRLNPTLPVLGVEIDQARVDAARPYADGLTDFRLGGFNLPLPKNERGEHTPVRAIRAFNVLRQYDEPDVLDAWQRLMHYLLPGGLLIEGTSDPLGRVWVANVLRKPINPCDQRPWTVEGLLFSTNFHNGFEPAQFQPVLPKNYIHRVVPGEPIFEFLSQWKSAAANATALQVWGTRQWFAATADAMQASGLPLRLSYKWWRLGYLMVQLPDWDLQ